MPAFALFTAVETDKFKESQECTSRGRCVQASRKRQENDGIAEEAATRNRIKGKAKMARALQRKAMNGLGQLGLGFGG